MLQNYIKYHFEVTTETIWIVTFLIFIISFNFFCLLEVHNNSQTSFEYFRLIVPFNTSMLHYFEGNTLCNSQNCMLIKCTVRELILSF